MDRVWIANVHPLRSRVLIDSEPYQTGTWTYFLDYSFYLSAHILDMSFLKISGTKIVDKDGKEVILRGAGLGGWMKYVLPITASCYPSC